jgi:hypothetical protein
MLAVTMRSAPPSSCQEILKSGQRESSGELRGVGIAGAQQLRLLPAGARLRLGSVSRAGHDNHDYIGGFT